MTFDEEHFSVTISRMSEENTTQAAGVPEGCRVFPFSTYSPWNNPEDLVSYTTQLTFTTIVDIYLLTVFFILSVPLNIVNMVVFWTHGIKERINLCLFCLSFADFIVVFGHFAWQSDRLISAITNTPLKLVVAKFTINNKIHSLAGFIYVSGFMSTLIAFERCFCIISPLKAHTIMQTKTTAAIIIIGHVLILGGHYIIAARWAVVCMFDPVIRKSTDLIYASDFYINHQTLVDIFEGTVFGILLPGFCVTGVTMTTFVIVMKLRKLKEWREQSTSTNASGRSTLKDINLTRMLIGTNVIFVLCTTPPLLFHTALPFVPDLSLSGKYYNTYVMFICLQQLSTYINCSVNFFAYYLFGTKFRLTVRYMFGECCRKKRENVNNMNCVQQCQQAQQSNK